VEEPQGAPPLVRRRNSARLWVKSPPVRTLPVLPAVPPRHRPPLIGNERGQLPRTDPTWALSAPRATQPPHGPGGARSPCPEGPSPERPGLGFVMCGASVPPGARPPQRFNRFDLACRVNCLHTRGFAPEGSANAYWTAVPSRRHRWRAGLGLDQFLRMSFLSHQFTGARSTRLPDSPGPPVILGPPRAAARVGERHAVPPGRALLGWRINAILASFRAPDDDRGPCPAPPPSRRSGDGLFISDGFAGASLRAPGPGRTTPRIWHMFPPSVGAKHKAGLWVGRPSLRWNGNYASPHGPRCGSHPAR